MSPVRIDRLDSVSLDIPADRYELISFTSAWGLEFEEVREPLDGETVLETRWGPLLARPSPLVRARAGRRRRPLGERDVVRQLGLPF